MLDVQSGGEVVHRAAVDVHGAAVDVDKSRDWTAEPPNTHTCALLVGGQVACWGDNRFSQAGSTTAVTSFPRPAVQLAVGPDHNCALLTDGSVACWGADPGGLLESTSANACPARCRYARCNAGPKRIRGLGDISRVRVGPRNPPFSCAVTRAGKLVCWGSGYGVNTVHEHGPRDASRGARVRAAFGLFRTQRLNAEARGVAARGSGGNVRKRGPAGRMRSCRSKGPVGGKLVAWRALVSRRSSPRY